MMKPSYSLRFPLRKLARGKASDAFSTRRYANGGLRLRTPTTGKQLYIDKVLHRQLLRMLEDSGFDSDFSEWVEQKMKDEIESQEERSLPPEASQ